MAHQQVAEAVDVRLADPTERLRNFVQAEEPQDTVEEPTEEPIEQVAEEPIEDLPEEAPEEEQLEAEEGEEVIEPETVIEVPVSLKAEEKAEFEQLPPEAQQFVSALEARRNADVTRVTTKAANAQRDAEALAANAKADAKVQAVQEMDEFVTMFQPQPPDPMLAQTNMQQYVLEQAQYQQQQAHFGQLKEHVTAERQKAEEAQQAEFIKSRDEALMRIPEIANPETRDAYLGAAFEDNLLADLQYDRGQLTQDADAQDIVRLRKISEWRDKAAKFDKANSTKMARVRSAKKANKPGTAKMTSGKVKAVADARTRLKQTGRAADAEAVFKAIVI